MIAGHATPHGTRSFASRHLRANYREFCGLALSSVGMGTYLGEPDGATDALVTEAAMRSARAGINVFDTAINYRGQRAERSVGRAIKQLEDEVRRDMVFVSTKGGYVTNDSEKGSDFWPYVNSEYVKAGTVSQGDISSGYHCMTARYLDDQLERSRKNLGLECIDLLYLHNVVEGQIKDHTMDEIREKISDIFAMYEQRRAEQKIRFYGLATWESLRVPRDGPQYLGLDELVNMAEAAGGEDHGFRFVQLPFNMYYDQALLLKNHSLGGAGVSVLEAAASYGIGVFASVPFMQGRLLSPGALPEFGDMPPNVRALQFIRSAPGVVAPLVGHKATEHVQANLEAMEIPPMSKGDFEETVRALVR